MSQVLPTLGVPVCMWRSKQVIELREERRRKEKAQPP